ncbi:MAG: hypothetical protein M1832_001317 [Thelocarpon impressellum]|nr:MAG: hypothetical protein M1832_001317 [Thelocarpon impressellum]
MSRLRARVNNHASCPRGGLWYTCSEQTPTFQGCCTSNPCNGVGCPASDLKPAGLGPDLSFAPNNSCPITGLWWTCSAQTPTFQGCCKTNPCNGLGCPAADLVAAGFGPPAKTPAAAPSSTSIAPNVLASASAAAAAAAADALKGSPSSPRSSRTPAIVGGIMGAAVFVTLVLIAVIFWRRRKARQSGPAASGQPDQCPPYGGPMTSMYTGLPSRGQNPHAGARRTVSARPGRSLTVASPDRSTGVSTDSPSSIHKPTFGYYGTGDGSPETPPKDFTPQTRLSTPQHPAMRPESAQELPSPPVVHEADSGEVRSRPRPASEPPVSDQPPLAARVAPTLLTTNPPMVVTSTLSELPPRPTKEDHLKRLGVPEEG